MRGKIAQRKRVKAARAMVDAYRYLSAEYALGAPDLDATVMASLLAIRRSEEQAAGLPVTPPPAPRWKLTAVDCAFVCSEVA